MSPLIENCITFGVYTVFLEFFLGQNRVFFKRNMNLGIFKILYWSNEPDGDPQSSERSSETNSVSDASVNSAEPALHAR